MTLAFYHFAIGKRQNSSGRPEQLGCPKKSKVIFWGALPFISFSHGQWATTKKTHNFLMQIERRPAIFILQTKFGYLQRKILEINLFLFYSHKKLFSMSVEFPISILSTRRVCIHLTCFRYGKNSMHVMHFQIGIKLCLLPKMTKNGWKCRK